jgi:hypothetical protein
VNAKPLLQAVVFSLRVNEFDFRFIGFTMMKGKCKINAFSHSQETLLNEKSLIEFAPLPYPLKSAP